MLDLKELLIMLGLAVGGPMPNQDMTFYRQKLSNEIVMEHKLQSEIKALEYRKMWDDVNKTEKTDFQNQLKSQWAETGGYPSWIFNEELCMFDAPSPRPDKHGNISYTWDELSLAWLEVIDSTE